ncbi:D-2-hydroxyacid dehydrogenase [Helicobacter anseris]|uniref:D-2-hydroxyacid dehydrogenase n=1 Tax=Helicobacter anseris TaxID=375926 RepID=A0A3D8JBX3_9HELI|nr:D-2-hydroxyacid dehydrogenase [Helicobacter anseris]RDU74401.1 D-2-hydroxyacid dehydrogenase [Helicobacter anseris]
MKKIVLLDAKTLGNISELEVLKTLGEFISYDTTPETLLYERVKDAQIVLTNKVVFSQEILEKLPNLELIAVTATGTNIIDMECAKKLGIEVKNVAGYSTKSVAQHTLTLVLNLLSQISYYDNYCKSGAWVKSEIFTHLSQGLGQIDGKQWGIIGLGEIGREVAKLATCFGAKVAYTSISNQPQEVEYSYQSLEKLLQDSDIISIHSPLTPKTKNLLNKDTLALLKQDCILINVGRGGIVNENDVAEYLKNKKIYFGTDVLENEPMQAGHPFLELSTSDRILITPHIAWAYENSKKALIQKVIENIKDFLKS